MSNKNKKTRSFIEAARKVHGEEYNYNKSLYIHSRKKIIITCKIHGDFLQEPSQHVSKKNRCPSCAKITRYDSAIKNKMKSKFINIVQPDGYKIIPLTKGYVCKIDNEDFKKVNIRNWVYCAGYAKSKSLGEMHRLIMDCPKGMVVDHINHDTLDNRKSNLRVCKQSENTRNKIKSKNKSSKYKGVHFCKTSNKWVSRIIYEHKFIFLGRYDTQEEAAKHYDKKAIELHGDFALINFNNHE